MACEIAKRLECAAFRRFLFQRKFIGTSVGCYHASSSSSVPLEAPRKWPARSRSVWSAPHSGAFFFRGNSSGLAWAVTMLLAARWYLLKHLENGLRDREAFGVRRIPALSFSEEIHRDLRGLLPCF